MSFSFLYINIFKAEKEKCFLKTPSIFLSEGFQIQVLSILSSDDFREAKKMSIKASYNSFSLLFWDFLLLAYGSETEPNNFPSLSLLNYLSSAQGKVLKHSTAGFVICDVSVSKFL